MVERAVCQQQLAFVLTRLLPFLVERELARHRLCMIMALWNRSFDLGEIKCKATLVAPVPSPNTVTFLGSPPKRAILALTHLNASICEEKSNCKN